jgi:transcriptional regulator with XRE-family HTH domain
MPDVSRKDHLDYSIAARLRIIRTEIGNSRDDFAKAIGISKDQLYNYESCRTPIPCGVALRVCRTFFADEKWLAVCNSGQYRPGVDLMGHPDYLNTDPSAPYSETFPTLESAYNELVQLPFYDMVERHLKSCGNDTFRLKQFTEFMFEFYSNNIAPWAHAELVEMTLKSLRKYLEYNEMEYAFGKGIISPGKYNGIPE